MAMELSSENTSALAAAISALCALTSLGFSIYTVRTARRYERIKNRPRVIVDLVKTGRNDDLLALRVINKGLEPAVEVAFEECVPIPKSIERTEGNDDAWFVKEPISFLGMSQCLICVVGSVHFLDNPDDERTTYHGIIAYKDCYGNKYREPFAINGRHYSSIELEAV
ncbi:MAG: hypothetical protein IJ146_08595 [Kiritimatiellae bacterium]|nr:hypothetical protein [Kiritimatiellia bacterium]